MRIAKSVLMPSDVKPKPLTSPAAWKQFVILHGYLPVYLVFWIDRAGHVVHLMGRGLDLTSTIYPLRGLGKIIQIMLFPGHEKDFKKHQDRFLDDLYEMCRLEVSVNNMCPPIRFIPSGWVMDNLATWAMSRVAGGVSASTDPHSHTLRQYAGVVFDQGGYRTTVADFVKAFYESQYWALHRRLQHIRQEFRIRKRLLLDGGMVEEAEKMKAGHENDISKFKCEIPATHQV